MEFIKFRNVEKTYKNGVNAVYNMNLDIKKGERVAIVGENGIGKTTLFKAIVGQLPITHGKIRFGSHVKMAYYDQEHESLDNTKTIFKEISDTFPRMTNNEIRSTLALFNFKGDDVFKDISILSAWLWEITFCIRLFNIRIYPSGSICTRKGCSGMSIVKSTRVSSNIGS